MKKYYIITYGCQSNFSDSERLASILDKKYSRASNKKDADLIIINCCSIRQSAVDRVYGQIKETSAKVIVTGCVLEHDRKKISSLAQFLTLSQFLEKDQDFFETKPLRESSFSALIPIMNGCDNFCTYCAVPYTRGREKSRTIKEIVNETTKAIKQGYKEIWLLGQNVNSYQPCFSSLLKSVADIPGDFWLRFTSSHPKDFDQKTIQTMKESAKVCQYLNLPVQSGDDQILKKMNRPYTVSQYKECVYQLKKAIPEVFLSTDVIVGFPGETEKQFQNTIKLFKELRFNMAYISRYSVRPGTQASLLKDNVSLSQKKKREEKLNNVLKKISLEENKKLVKKKVQVLIDKKRKEFVWGKTKNYHTVKLEGDSDLIGKFIDVEITEALPWGLKGKRS
jgi:tRNA-2-methylthio-N6-dimethylallyladenosine synthase